MNTRNLLIVLGIAFIFFSCRKDRDIIEEPKTPETMDALQVPASFNWKTTKDITVTLTGFTSGIAEITNDQNQAYHKAYLTVDQAYTTKITLPAYETKVTLKFMGLSTEVTLNGATLNHQFVNP